MLENYEKFHLCDLAKENDIFVEVNWNPEDEKTNQCKVLKFILPCDTEKKEAFIKREDLKNLLFYISEPMTQMKMGTQILGRSREYETVVGITAKKDIRKGERIVVPLKLRLPDIEDIALVEAMKRFKIPKKAIEKKPLGIIKP
uniref:Uncharacterized protein n=1 Tax=candidate division CPR3 bacterium TaxID=2268181 RepID=A0A7V3JAD3_UNCC3